MQNLMKFRTSFCTGFRSIVVSVKIKEEKRYAYIILANTWDFNRFGFQSFKSVLLVHLFLIANTIRRKTPFLRNYLVPTGLIAGFLGLGLKYLFQWLGVEIYGTPIVDESYMHFLTYHSLAIGFIALGLVTAEKKVEKEGRALKSGALIVGGYLIQGIVGLITSLGVSLIFVNYAIGKAPYAGVLLPLGLVKALVSW